MAGQSIKLKIAGEDYSLVALTPEMESLMRTAAQEINQMKDIYDQKFPGRTIQDKLAFIALNQTVSKLALQKKKAAQDDSLKLLEEQLSTYLSKIE